MLPYNEQLLHPCTLQEVQSVAEDGLVGYGEESVRALEGDGGEVQVVGVNEQHRLQTLCRHRVLLRSASL